MTVNLESCQVAELQKISQQFTVNSNFLSFDPEKFRNITSKVVGKNDMLLTVKNLSPSNLAGDIRAADITRTLSDVGSAVTTVDNKLQSSDLFTENPLICYKCHKSFPSQEEVVIHLKLIHNACATRDCSKLSDFKMHSLVCSNRGFGCAVCNKKFTEKYLLLMHFNQHINAAFYVCDVCRAGFQQRKHLQRHLLEVHDKNVSVPVTPSRSKAVYQKCDQCSKYFKLFSEFEEHKSLCNSMTFSCKICKIGFLTSTDLESHKYIEHKLELPIRGYFALKDGKRYFCGICYIGFFKGGVLKEHIQSHGKEIDHVCDECHSSFSCDEDLQAHYLQHIEEHYVLQDVIKQHSCSSCERTFKTLVQLKNHMEHENCKNNFIETKDNNLSPCSETNFKEFVNDYQKNSTSGSSSVKQHIEARNNENHDNENLNINVADNHAKETVFENKQSQMTVESDNTVTSYDEYVIISSSNNENMDFQLNSQNTVQHEISNFGFDISDIPVYALKDGDELLNCDDGYCVVVIDQKSYFVLQRGICASESRMPHIQNSEAFNETDEIDASVLQNHMLQILAPPANSVEELVENIENKTVNEQGPKSLNFSESDSVIHCDVLENSEIYFESAPLGQESTVPNNQNYGMVFSVNACNPVVPEDSVPYINGDVTYSKAVPNDLHVECQSPFSVSVPHICNICQQVFSSRTSLCLHMKGSHTGFDCYRCGQSFNSQLELSEHEKNAHQSSFKCDLCDVVYTKEYLLKKHKRSAHGGKFFVCDVCDKSYVLRNEYEIHLMLHRGETPPTKCDICGKVYASISNYMRHRAAHEGINPPKKYICNVCDKAFPASNPLKRHLVTHIRKTAFSYECPKCKMYFSPKSLSRHVDMHDAVS